jgi:hypothetical protein
LTDWNFSRVRKAVHQRWNHAISNQRWQKLSEQVARAAPASSQAPVIFFNASTRLEAVSQNAAYSLLTSESLLLAGVPVIYFVCRSGLDRCVLGSNRNVVEQEPPCERCIAQSKRLYPGASVRWLDENPHQGLDSTLERLNIAEMEAFAWQGVPLGTWAVNSLRWVLRRHHLLDDEPTRTFFRSFIHSAWNVYTQFNALVEETSPQAVIVFNGMFYPESAARFVCLKRGIRVITHEVGLQPFTAFFTPGEATAYPIHISDDFQLTAEMNQRLDNYLAQRMQGNFSMAGVRFWPQMKGLGTEFLAKAAQFKHIVPVFTNVIFDTSQVHANTLFPEMFAWLNDVLTAVEHYPETLFVIRAHPDEGRAGKESQESVAQWVRSTGADRLPNVIFVDAGERLSSYDLIQRSHFVMVYNSTIGLEAAILGKAVLAGGKARFTQLSTSFFPRSLEEYRGKLAELLDSESIQVPVEFQVNARRFLYFQLYVTSLPFDEFIEDDGVWKGYVKLKDFPIDALRAEHSPTMRVLCDGILQGNEFELKP